MTFKGLSCRVGTMLMEAVLAVPVVVLLVLACFQFIMIAYAKLMTEHAAQVALRVAEVQCTLDRKDAALSAARRILAPVSWSSNYLDISQYKEYKDKAPSCLSDIVGLAAKAPDGINFDFVDVPADARQPLGWFPIWNTSWLESQVDVALEQNNDTVPRLECVVTFLCPLHVPIIADALLSASELTDSGAVTNLTPKILWGHKSGPSEVPCIVLKAKAFRVLTHKTVGTVMPPVEKGGITGL